MIGTRKGNFFDQKWYIKKGKGLDLGAEPPHIKLWASCYMGRNGQKPEFNKRRPDGSLGL